jgi:hypothetical protein
MRSKLVTVFSFVLLATATVLADTNVTASSFLLPPKVVFDTSSDKFFANVTSDTFFFSAGESNDTIYAWSAKEDMITNSSLLLLKIAIDTSTLKVKGDGVTLNLTLKSKVPLSIRPHIGYISFASVRDDGEGTADQLYFSILPASADSATELSEVKLMESKYMNSSFGVVDALLQDGYFYVIFIEFDISSGFEKAIYLQAVKVSDGSFLFPSAVKVASLNNPPSTTDPVFGLNSDSNATMFYVVYKVNETSTIFQITVSLPNGKVDEPTSLVADNDTVIYETAAIISASKVFGVTLYRFKKDQDQKVVEKVKVYYNGTTSKPQTLNFTIPEGYNLILDSPFSYDSGFGVLAVFFGDSDVILDLKIFNSDGSQKAPQKSLVTTSYALDGMIFFADASGAVWLGYIDYDNSNDMVLKGYLGKILA